MTLLGVGEGKAFADPLVKSVEVFRADKQVSSITASTALDEIASNHQLLILCTTYAPRQSIATLDTITSDS
ncbi:MAG: hypothetical protein KatS3mg056_0047 [Chloroflexus sp.]|nr:MAG: hypothetical protein KatS3mg056_0047 [Chloroflexus sp.]